MNYYQFWTTKYKVSNILLKKKDRPENSISNLWFKFLSRVGDVQFRQSFFLQRFRHLMFINVIF